ncbi:MAG: prepilin-type N-terminal cleavage/methylation domain-containing protein [Desulfobacteraceae bacterium]|nr:MAG: prepilin-type N-terminal cleavage/methylation domain-containing protein [Desulfobacteraceae bacterium]
MMPVGRRTTAGFTLVELLMTLGLSGIVSSMIMYLFFSQQESYRTQIRMASLQQNLRTAMNILSADIRMAGYCTSMDHSVYDGYLDWDPRQKGAEAFSPLIHGIDNIVGVGKYRENTDVIMIVKAGEDGGILEGSECALANQHILFIHDLDLDGDGDEDFAMGGREFGVVMKSDFSGSQLFKMIQKGPPMVVADPFHKNYMEGDVIKRADIIIYRIDDANASFSQSVLERKNAGNGNRFQVVAEGITDLQFRYFLGNGAVVEDPDDTEEELCAVEVFLAGEVETGRGGKQTRSLVTVLTIRNM